MVIFHSYVSLPKGIYIYVSLQEGNPQSLPHRGIFLFSDPQKIQFFGNPVPRSYEALAGNYGLERDENTYLRP